MLCCTCHLRIQESLNECVAVALSWIFVIIFVQVLHSVPSVSSDSKENSSSESFVLAVLRDNVPDQALPCEDTTENGRNIFHA